MMPDILIRGIGIPSKSDLVVHIYPDGKAVFYPFHSKPRKVEVLELPPHGDLIDRDAFLKRSPDHWDEEYIEGDDEYVYRYYLDSTIEAAPVVVPAEREGES
jgi:hypothetical protein